MARHPVLQTFYASRPWREFRLSLIAERGNRCQMCGKIIPRSIDIIGHHKIELTPENVRDAMIALNPDNVDLVCFDCHNMDHQRFGYQSKKGVYLVYGPPFAGKKEFLNQNMKRGDLLIDMDSLYMAMSGLMYYDKPDNLFSNVITVHNALLDQVKTRYGKWNNAWIVGGYADKFKRERTVADLGAELVYCESTMDECLKRLQEDAERRHRLKEWQGYIEKWFEQYRE